VLPRSDGAGEFGEDRCESMPWVDIHAEFVVAAVEVLDESVPALIIRAERSRFRPRIGPWAFRYP
jgi:hypothetical protein